MKKLFAAAAGLSVALLIPIAEAAPKTIEACTQDGKTATLTLEAEGSVLDRTVESIVHDAFVSTAKQVTGKVLLKPEGVQLFHANTIAALHDLEAANPGKAPDMTGQKLVLMGFTIDGPACTP